MKIVPQRNYGVDYKLRRSYLVRKNSNGYKFRERSVSSMISERIVLNRLAKSGIIIADRRSQ